MTLRRSARCVSRSDARRLCWIDRWNSRVKRSGSNPGSPTASAQCIAAVRSASSTVNASITASSPVASGSDTRRSISRVSRSWLHSQRSLSLGMASWTTTTLAGRASPGRVTSSVPATPGTFVKPIRRRCSGSVTSGFSPGVSRRISLAMTRPPSTADELDCSTPNGWTSRGLSASFVRPRASGVADGEQLPSAAPSCDGAQRLPRRLPHPATPWHR